MTDRHDDQPKPWSRTNVLLWLGLLAGPIAFSADLVASYTLVSFTAAEEHGQHPILYAITAVALLATLIALAIANRLRTRAESPRMKFMAVGGAVMSAFFAVVIVAEAIPKVVLRMGE